MPPSFSPVGRSFPGSFRWLGIARRHRFARCLSFAVGLGLSHRSRSPSASSRRPAVARQHRRAAARIVAWFPRLAAHPVELRGDRASLPRGAAGRWPARLQGGGCEGCDRRNLPRPVGCDCPAVYASGKSLLSYARELGYTRFNAGTTIKVRSDTGNRGAALAKRIISPTQVSLLIRAARTRRDRVLLEVLYAGGLASVSWSVWRGPTFFCARRAACSFPSPARAARCVRCCCRSVGPARRRRR